MDPSLPTRRWWRRLPARLSLRMLMAVILALSAGLGWVVHRARVQREAVLAIERSHGWFTYGLINSSGLPIPNLPGMSGQEWVRRELGRDFLDTVTYVNLRGEGCTDETLRAACRLPDLELLTLVDTLATDAGAESIRSLANLQFLSVSGNKITPRPLRHIGEMGELRNLTLDLRRSSVPLKDGDLAFLRRLTKLESLMLIGKGPTDAWLANIEKLTNLASLHVYTMAITTEGLAHLRGLPNLKDLTLHGSKIEGLEPLRSSRTISTLDVTETPVDDSALSLLRDWPRLADLNLKRTKVTDVGLVALGELPSLDTLDLAGTAVTDAGLKHLARSKSLRWLSVEGTKVTDAGKAEFSRSNPMVNLFVGKERP